MVQGPPMEYNQHSFVESKYPTSFLREIAMVEQVEVVSKQLTHRAPQNGVA